MRRSSIVLALVLTILVLGACGFNQFGPWRDESGQPLEGSQILQYTNTSTYIETRIDAPNAGPEPRSIAIVGAASNRTLPQADSDKGDGSG